MSIFDVEPYIASATLEGKSFLIYGTRKVGKTSIAVKFPKPFIIGFERGWSALNNVKAIPVKDWNHFKKDFVKPLLKDAEEFEKGKKDSLHYTTLIVDTGDIAYDMCYSYVCSKEGVTHLDETENKRGYKMCKKEFEDTMLSLMKSGYTVVFISHAEGKQVKDEITKEKEDKIVPTMDKNAFAIISRAVDMTAYCRIIDDANGETKRVMYLRSNGDFEAGSRWGKHLPNAVMLDYNEFESAVVNAIEKQAEEDGVTPTAHNVSLFKTADEAVVYDYEELLDKVQQIGKKLHEEDRLEIMTELAEQKLGVGKKLSQCSKLQVEVMYSILDMIEDKMREEGIELPY